MMTGKTKKYKLFKQTAGNAGKSAALPAVFFFIQLFSWYGLPYRFGRSADGTFDLCGIVKIKGILEIRPGIDYSKDRKERRDRS
jgi:hypothetical protein